MSHFVLDIPTPKTSNFRHLSLTYNSQFTPLCYPKDLKKYPLSRKPPFTTDPHGQNRSYIGCSISPPLTNAIMINLSKPELSATVSKYSTKLNSNLFDAQVFL